MRRGIAAAFGILFAGSHLGAQVNPGGEWRTLHTPHFRVTFSPEMEPLARRTAASAESAWVQLAAELVPPRGTVDIVLGDNVDFSNGFATTFPTNRIVLYAQPPVDVASLRYYTDWTTLLVTHELTHVFHLDRARGFWRLGQSVVGRVPYLFPNGYAPAWVTEGLAVYYESRLTGSGRLAGSAHRLVAEAAAAEGLLPRLDELSLGSPRFPGGQRAYAYGSLLIDRLADANGADRVRAFIERSSAAWNPFRLDHIARHTFGESFSESWRTWVDSLGRIERAGHDPWRELTREGYYASYPRWRSDSAIVYVASSGREIGAAFEITLDGGRRRLGRRNSLDANVPRGDGAIVFAQLEFLSPHVIRSDLWARETGGRTRRLTRGARLASPDVRADDGTIVAVQATGGATRLVRVRADGSEVTPLTDGSADEQWTEPRWSPAGDRIVAVRWTRGARYSLVVLDTAGRVLGEPLTAPHVLAAPAWAPRGDRIYAILEHPTPRLVEVALAANGTQTTVRAAEPGAAGVFQPAIAPGGDRVAAAVYRADGYHIGVAELEALFQHSGVLRSDTGRAAMPRPALHATVARRYSPWRTLAPRYWLPVVETTGEGPTLWGASSGGTDVVGRHAWAAQGAMGRERGVAHATLAWSYRGLGQPYVDASLEHFARPSRAVTVGAERWPGRYALTEQIASAGATLVRPRMRTYGWMRLGAEAEHFREALAPDSVRARVGFPRLTDRVAAVLSGGWSNTQRPSLAISPEDGVSLAASARRRWLVRGGSSRSLRLTGSASGYKALDLPGFAHHVLALRVAGGWTDAPFADFDAGGTTGSSVPLIGNYALGGERRMFFIRGFPGAAQSGTRAAVASLEYRAPLLLVARGWRMLPLFFDRSALAGFVDAGSAWCAGGSALTCGPRVAPSWLAAAGAELHLDAAVLSVDVPYRLRAGIAAPIVDRGRSDVRADPLTGYLALGAAF